MPQRFVADHALERLARRLRLAGYDVRSARGARLDELYQVAANEDLIVLTPSHRHPARFGPVPAVVVPREDVRAALRLVAGRYEPGGPPFSRCLECNTALERRHAIEAAGEVPGRVTRAFRELSHCPTCGRWYWEGTHVARLRAWLADALGAGATGD